MKWTKKGLNNLFFIVGLAAVVGMILTFDVSFAELWEQLTKAGYWLIPIIGIWIFVYGLNAVAWQTIIKSLSCPIKTIFNPTQITFLHRRTLNRIRL